MISALNQQGKKSLQAKSADKERGGLGTASQKGLCLFDYMICNETKKKLKSDLLKDPTYKIFLERTEKIRENNNSTQEEFASALGVTQGTYNSVINGRIGSAYIMWQIIKLMKGDLRWLNIRD